LETKAMKVIRATEMGLCFGVRDALATAAAIEDPSGVTIYGELVHNRQVLVQLASQGFQTHAESERQNVPSSSTILVTAHGISDRSRDQLIAAGKTLIDTTCPLVRRVHESAQRLVRDGFHVLVIGRPGHVEVQGVVEDLDSCEVIEAVEDVKSVPFSRIGVICQSTTPPRQAERILTAIRDRNPTAEVRFINTICEPTAQRQQALEQLCRLVDVVVVVGGANSNNTRQLVNLAHDQGVPAWRVDSAGDLRREWFADCRCVGLTAGTSTLDETVDEVYEALCALPSQRVDPP
jgi:4-hydroxy-3-methylbut-2-en-1-yl diphosphate reductase